MAPRHLDKLDTLRGVSAVLVMLAHVIQIIWAPVIGIDHWASVTAGIIARHAVILFFLLSGYLITESIRQNRGAHAGRISVADFALSRIARIYPPLVASLVLVAAILLVMELARLPGTHGLVFGRPDDIYRAREALSFRGTDFVNALLLRSGPPIDGPLWTLFIEWKLYWMALSAAVLVLPGPVLRRAVAAACLAALVFTERNYPDFWMFAAIWVIGALSRLIDMTKARLPLLALPAIIVAINPRLVLVLNEPAGQTTQCAFAAAYAALLFPERVRLPEVLRPLAGWGRFSYSLYIIHFPLIIFMYSLAVPLLPMPGVRLMLSVISVGACILLSMGFAALFERPRYYRQELVRLAQRIRPRWRSAPS